MISANRYLVWWESSVAGEQTETKHTPEGAKALLRERERRGDFVRGFVVDMNDYTRDAGEVDEAHRRAVRARRPA